MAGYSGTPLQQKLGLKEDWLVRYAGAVPEGFGADFAGVTVKSRGPVDAAVLFVTRRAQLERRFGPLASALPPAGMLWVAWPKQSSGVPTDVTENVLREALLPTGWVDVKVCAVDETWSGLKFVKRVGERGRASS